MLRTLAAFSLFAVAVAISAGAGALIGLCIAHEAETYKPVTYAIAWLAIAPACMIKAAQLIADDDR